MTSDPSRRGPATSSGRLARAKVVQWARPAALAADPPEAEPQPASRQARAAAMNVLRIVGSVSPIEFDRALLRLARTRAHPAWLERVVGAYSRTGEHAACWLALGLVGAGLSRGRGRREWLRGVRVVAGAYTLNYAVKVTVRRHRPELPGLDPLTPTVSRLSFPSAHATTSFAAARAYSRMLPPAPLYLAAAIFAASRPYLGVHYPSDVVAGAALGTVLAGAWPA
jgi:membrane-associated phospholipid phosphatase